MRGQCMIKSNSKLALALLLFAQMFHSCFGGPTVMSQRSLNEAAMEGDRQAVSIREIEDTSPRRELYLKQKDVSVRPARTQSETGSLNSVDDSRSYLLATKPPIAVGEHLEVKVSSNRIESKDTPQSATPGGADASGDKTDAKSTAAVEDVLLKALPDLEQAGSEKPTIIKNFKVQVYDILENGDALVMFHRRSIRGDQAADVLVRGRIPYSSLSDRENLSTNMMEDISFRESQDGDITERHSLNWEDEYTLRLSGFDEAKSKSALALEEKAKQLQEARGKVVTQIKSMGSERQTMAKERDGYLKKQKDDEQKIEEMEAKLKEQESELADLRPKPEEDEEKSDDDTKSTDAEKKGAGAKLTDKPASAKGDSSKKEDEKKGVEKKEKPAPDKKPTAGVKK
jgi:hypothetical protein